MKLVCVIDPKRLDKIPDKTIVLLSSRHIIDQGYEVKRIELRLYLQKFDKKSEQYSIITTYVETDSDSVEMIFEEGYKGNNALEEAAAYITSHLTIQNILLRSIQCLKKQSKIGNEDIVKKKCDELIQLMKKKGFLTEKKIEDVIRKTPRHLFVPSEYVESAYEDRPFPTKHGQTISQPSVVARMTEWLDVNEGQKILEIGCGSGWQSAIISKLVGEKTVYTIDKISEITEFAKKNHEKAKIKNVEIIQGDGSLGLEQKAPFDRIIITAACPQVPKPLLEQLAEGGILVAPVGKGTQSMILLRKTPQGIKEEKREYGYVFAPLLGKFGFKNSLFRLGL